MLCNLENRTLHDHSQTSFRAKLRYSTCVFFSFAQRNKFSVKVEYFLLFLSMLFKNCKKTFLLLAETTSKISQTTLRSYLRIVHRKNVSMVSDESYIFSLQSGILSSNMLQSRSLPLIQNQLNQTFPTILVYISVSIIKLRNWKTIFKKLYG